MAADRTRRAAPIFDREHLYSADRSGRRKRRPAPDWGGDELFDHVPRRRFAHDPGEPPAGAPPPRAPLAVSGPAAPEATEVTAGGKRRPARASARPPGRSVEQRIAASPDRVAAWAFALGLLLILVAIATSL